MNPKSPKGNPGGGVVRPLRIGGSRKPEFATAGAPKTVLSTQVISEAEQAQLAAASDQLLAKLDTPSLTKAESATLISMEKPVESRNKFTSPPTGTAHPMGESSLKPTGDFDVMNTGDVIVDDPAPALPQNPTVDIRPKQDEPPYVDLGQQQLNQATSWDPLETKVMKPDTLIRNVAGTIGPNVSEFDAMNQDLFAEKAVTNPVLPQPPTSGAGWQDQSTTGDAKLFGKPETQVPTGDAAAPADVTKPRKNSDPRVQFGLADDDFPPPEAIPAADTIIHERMDTPRKLESVGYPAVLGAIVHLEEIVSDKISEMNERMDESSKQYNQDQVKVNETRRELDAALNEIRDCMKPLEHAVTIRQDARDTDLRQYIEKLERTINALGIDATRETLQEIVTEVGNLKNTVSALQLTVNESRGDVSKVLESQSRAETDIKGLRENQNTINTAFGELKVKTEAALTEIEKKAENAVQIQMDGYTLASETKFNTAHLREDVVGFANEVKSHVDGKLNAVLASEKELREKMEAMPGLNSDLATKLADIAASVKTLADEAAKPKPPVQAPTPPPATPAPVAAPAQAAAPTHVPHTPAAPTTPPTLPVTTQPCQPQTPTRSWRRNWGFGAGLAAGAAVMLAVITMHACSGPDRYASNDRMVFSKIEGGVVGGNIPAPDQVEREVRDVTSALAAIAFTESSNRPTVINVHINEKGQSNDYFVNPGADGPALGKYQMMTKFWPEWAKLAGVDDTYINPIKWVDRDTPEKIFFRVPEEVQDAVARAHFEALVKKHHGSLEEAIKDWNPTQPEYLGRVLKNAGKKTGAT